MAGRDDVAPGAPGQWIAGPDVEENALVAGDAVCPQYSCWIDVPTLNSDEPDALMRDTRSTSCTCVSFVGVVWNTVTDE